MNYNSKQINGFWHQGNLILVSSFHDNLMLGLWQIILLADWMTGDCKNYEGHDQKLGGYPKGEVKKFDKKEDCGNYCLSAIGSLATGCEYNEITKHCLVHTFSVTGTGATGTEGGLCFDIPPYGWLFCFTSFWARGHIVSILSKPQPNLNST